MIEKKGQASIEMIVTAGVIILIFIVCLMFSQMKIKESNEYIMFLDAKRICNSVANNVDTIAEQGPGYFRYISLPDEIRGGYAYDIVTYTKFVEIEWDNPSYSPWNTQIITKNVSFCCNGTCNTSKGSRGKLSMGLDKRNKVYNDDGKIVVSCHMPDIRFFEGTFLPTGAKNNENITVQVEVINFGPIDAGAFKVGFTHIESGRRENVSVTQLNADSSRIVRANFTAPAWGNYSIELDYMDAVPESIESNNNYTVEVGLI